MLPRNQELIDEFLKFKVEEYGISPKTYTVYLEGLTYFVRYLEEKHDCTLDKLTPEIIKAYKDSLAHYRDSTIFIYISPIRGFCNWASHETGIGLYDTNPMPNIKLKTGGKLETHCLTAKEVFDIRASQVIVTLDCAVIFELLISSGMRLSEMLHLRACDVDFRIRPMDGSINGPSPYCGGLIRTEGYGSGSRIKAAKERKIYLGKLAAKLLIAYMKTKKIPFESNLPIFPLHPGMPGHYFRQIAKRTNLIKKQYREVSQRRRGFLDIDVNNIVGTEEYKNLVRKAQEKERKEIEAGSILEKASRVQPARRVTLHPHSARHFFAYLMYYRNWYGNRKDILDLRDLLGHSSVVHTNIYVINEKQVVDNDRDWIRIMNGTGLEYRTIFSEVGND